jgi:hypothetical protein
MLFSKHCILFECSTRKHINTVKTNNQCLCERQILGSIFSIAVNFHHEDLEFLKLDSAPIINLGPLEARGAMVNYIGYLFLSFATSRGIINGGI